MDVGKSRMDVGESRIDVGESRMDVCKSRISLRHRSVTGALHRMCSERSVDLSGGRVKNPKKQAL